MIPYILFNTLVYWTIAFVLSGYFAYAKYLNLATGSFMILAVYAISVGARSWRSLKNILIVLAAFLLYRLVNHIILQYFKNEKQRDLFWFIFTLGCAILVESSTQIIYGSSPASLDTISISWLRLGTMLICMHILIQYTFAKSYWGKVRQGIYSNTWAIRTLGISVHSMLHLLFSLFFLLSIGLAVLIAQQWAIRPSDHLFYMIKWLGIMILVWVEKRQYVYIGALLYVIVEYLLFIARWSPLGYKEALILVVLLMLLVLRPEGLFSFRQRSI